VRTVEINRSFEQVDALSGASLCGKAHAFHGATTGFVRLRRGYPGGSGRAKAGGGENGGLGPRIRERAFREEGLGSRGGVAREQIGGARCAARARRRASYGGSARPVPA
jgi:hypothetical protein